MQQVGSVVLLMVLVVAGIFLITEKKEMNTSGGAPFAIVQVPFTELTRGDNSKLTKHVNYLVTSDEGLAELWKMIGTKSAMPKVDFSSHSVIAVFAGEQKTAGYSVAVAKIEDDSSARTVTISRTAPGNGCVVAQAKTSPYQVVLVPSTVLTFSHTETLTTTDCQ